MLDITGRSPGLRVGGRGGGKKESKGVDLNVINSPLCTKDPWKDKNIFTWSSHQSEDIISAHCTGSGGGGGVAALEILAPQAIPGHAPVSSRNVTSLKAILGKICHC